MGLGKSTVPHLPIMNIIYYSLRILSYQDDEAHRGHGNS